MKRAARAFRCFFLLMVCGLLICQLLPGGNKPVSASPGVLLWDIVDTPANGLPSNIIVTQSEINAIALGSDDSTFYAVDVGNNRLFKSTDGGLTWPKNITPAVAAGQTVWNVSVAPEDVNFIVAITGGSGAGGGPRSVSISTDGGQNWETPTPPALAVGEFISCVEISRAYNGSNRYIAIGTRRGAANGRVFTIRAPGYTGWVDQTVAPSLNWAAGDVVALKFSPTYLSDFTIVITYASAAGLFLTLGYHDTDVNKTTWSSELGFPRQIRAKPTHDEIITADLELPSDFSGSAPGLLRRGYVSFDARTTGAPLTYFSGIFRIDNDNVYQLKYTEALFGTTPERRISSISYYGTYGSGKLIAGETTIYAQLQGRCPVDIWLCLNPYSPSLPVEWKYFTDNADGDYKCPTGGANTALGRANAIVAWSAAGSKAYCATSSAELTVGGTSFALPANRWPRGLLNTQPLDESAFSVSSDEGRTWNQISLIDTEITSLADVAIFEPTEESEQTSVLYLATINDIVGPDQRFDSIWRSTSDPLARQWERVLCTLTTNNDIILRGNPRILEEKNRSKVIVFADRATEIMYYSANEGQNWKKIAHPYQTRDFTLASDDIIYVLCDTFVVKFTRTKYAWTWGNRVLTLMATGHTIATPLKNPVDKNRQEEDWVIVGSETTGEVAYSDFSKPTIQFDPPADQRKRLPRSGDAHVLCDEQFNINYTIYAASGNVEDGKIYRWIIGKSTQWDELQPPNNDFRGLEQGQGALYGAFDVPAPPYAGVDRTLEPRKPVPPPPEWDDLTASYDPTVYNAVVFTREPSALKISSRVDNSLWAIDNRPYNWGTKQGCLWNYVDTLVVSGPWSTSPASNDVIPMDPVTGRANEVNFAWRSLSLASAYELQVAKDKDFTMLILRDENVVPPDQVSPTRIQLPGLLEAGHKYFWRVRVRRATTGEIIRSPWSATMFFTVMSGFPVEAKHLGPTLLKPPNQCQNCSSSPAFSWSPMFQTTQYEFILARDAGLTQVIETAKVATTAYEYKGKLDKGTYFWRVQAIKPMLSEPSPIGCFTVVDIEKPVSVFGIEVTPQTSALIWVGLSLYALFVMLMLLFIMKTRFRR